MAGLTPLFNLQDIENRFDRFIDSIDDKIIEILQYLGETGVKVARESGAYHDITGNLRSSIGYVVAKDGRALDENFQPAGSGTDRTTGVEQARKLASKVLLSHDKGYVMILVAGMEYAVYVENMDTKDVLSGAVTETEKTARELVKKLKNG